MRAAINVVFLLLATSLAAQQTAKQKKESVPGQKPIPMMAGQFRFVEGAWGNYRITDQAKNETYDMWFAVLGTAVKKGVAHRWMEVEVRMPKQPVVVTKFLADETEDGPGALEQVIVQVQGYSPFNVPKKFMKEGKREVVPVVRIEGVPKTTARKLVYQGRSIAAMEVQAQDQDGHAIRAVASPDLPPLGIYDAEANGMRIQLQDSGLDAKTRVRGTPINFYLWLLDQIAKGV